MYVGEKDRGVHRETGSGMSGEMQDVKGEECFHPRVILGERDDKRKGTLKSRLKRSQNFKDRERQYTYVMSRSVLS